MTLDLIEYLAKKVVDQPESVRVEQTGDREVTYMIHVAPGEEGRIIGRNGRVIQAIRTVARAAAGPRERVQVDVAGGSSRTDQTSGEQTADEQTSSDEQQGE
jgi:uncharacterized protein